MASQDWPEVTKYAGLVCAQAHRQELIQDLYKTWHDPQRGTMHGGMIKYVNDIIFCFFLMHFSFLLMNILIICFIVNGKLQPTICLRCRSFVNQGTAYFIPQSNRTETSAHNLL